VAPRPSAPPPPPGRGRAGRGPGRWGEGPAAPGGLPGSLPRLDDEVGAAFAAGLSMQETIGACTDPWAEGLDAALAKALARYPVPTARAQQSMLELCRNLHRLNILATYRLYQAAAADGAPA